MTPAAEPGQARAATARVTRLAGEEDWGEDIHVHEGQEEMDRALGTCRQGFGLLSIWWD